MFNNSINTTIQNYASQSDSLSSWKSMANCVPMMLAHLNRYGEDLKIWGVPVRMVTFLAIVDDIDCVSTRVNFRFHDETGSIRGIKWIDSHIYQTPVKINSYARVYGTMRREKEENYVLITSIQPMEHLNELCAHLMEVTVSCLEAENMSIKAAQNRSTFSSTSTDNNNSSITLAPSIDSAYSNLSRDHILILDIITRGHPEDGAERNSIKSQVPSYLVSKVDAILDFLSSEGHIYTTKSDDHFKKL